MFIALAPHALDAMCGYFSALDARAPIIVKFQSYFLYRYFFDIFGMMMIGMALFKLGVLTLEAKTRTYLAMMAGGYAIGFPLNIFEANWIMSHGFSSLAYHQAKSTSVSEIESRLNRAGYPIGIKLLDLLLYRETPRTAKRPTRILELLQFIHGTLWRALFNRNADALEQSTSKKNEYMIIDNEPLVNTFISIPKEMSQLNCAAFIAGIIEGMCDATGLSTDGVTAHWAGEGDELWPGKTIFLLRFTESVV